MINFDWDPDKAASNLEKHKVGFDEATQVFLDHHRLEMEDNRYDYGEIRWITIGLVKKVMLTVVYTERENTIRIISARKAHKNEREEYQKLNRIHPGP